MQARRLYVACASAAIAMTFAACAPKMDPAPPAIGAPRFPDFIYPAAPPSLGTPASLERHDVGWRWLQAGDLRAAERNFTAALKLTPEFYPAEAYHQDYFSKNPHQPYCTAIVAPKVAKVRKYYFDRLAKV